MTRYVAFLRGVSPMNANMAELRRSFEGAGFTDVKTVLSSGNVAFTARASSESALERRAERAMAKRLVTFLRKPPRRRLSLPVEMDGARILAVRGREVFTAYVPSPRGPVFMALLEKTFGKEVTTRTWETVRKCAAA